MKKRKIIISILIILQLIIVCTYSRAASSTESYKATLKSDSTELKVGETTSIKLYLSDINMGNGIMGLSAKLTFDENVFEPITVNSLGSIQSGSLSKLKGLEGWSNPTYSQTTKVFAMDAGDFLVDDNNVIELALKVKDNVSVTETTIQLTNIIASNGEKDIEAEDTSIILKIVANTDKVDDNKNNDTIVDDNKNDNTDNTDKVDTDTKATDKSTTTSTSKTTSDQTSTKPSSTSSSAKSTTTLPYTGINAMCFIIIIAVVIVIGIINYIKYYKMKDLK